MKRVLWSSSGASGRARTAVKNGTSFELVFRGPTALAIRTNLAAGAMTPATIAGVAGVVGLTIVMAVVAYAIKQGYSVRLVFRRNPPEAVIVFKAP